MDRCQQVFNLPLFDPLTCKSTLSFSREFWHRSDFLSYETSFCDIFAFYREFCYSKKSLPIRDGKVVKLRFLGIFECNPISLLERHRNVTFLRFLGIFGIDRISFPTRHRNVTFLRFLGKMKEYHSVYKIFLDELDAGNELPTEQH